MYNCLQSGGEALRAVLATKFHPIPRVRTMGVSSSPKRSVPVEVPGRGPQDRIRSSAKDFPKARPYS
jgi:hypothetical protein